MERRGSYASLEGGGVDLHAYVCVWGGGGGGGLQAQGVEG